MKLLDIRTWLTLLILLGLFCTQVQARIVVGLSPSDLPLETGQQRLQALSTHLQNVSGEPVIVRSFDTNNSLINWLVRFREVDLALFSHNEFRAQSAGQYHHLADLHLTGRPEQRVVLVARQDLDQTRRTEARQAFLNLGKSRDGAAALRDLGIMAVTGPGEKRPRAALPPKPASSPKAQPKAEAQTAPSPKKTATKATVSKPSSDTLINPDMPAVTGLPVEPKTPADLVADTTTQENIPSTSPPEKMSAPTQRSPVSSKTDAEDMADKRERLRIYLFAAMIIIAGILLKVWLIAKRLQGKKKQDRPAAPAPELDVLNTSKPLSLKSDDPVLTTPRSSATTTVSRSEQTMAEPDPAVEASPTELCPAASPTRSTIGSESPSDQVFDTPILTDDGLSNPPEQPETPVEESIPTIEAIEAGTLGPGQVPMLLKRCADMPEPVILEVTKASFSKRVYFAAGQIAHASPWENLANQGPGQENKLSYLLIRDGIISEGERDRALELMEEKPGLRMGEALLQLALIDLAALRQALTRQTKLEIYSLILFPQGEYRILPDDNKLSAEESVSLEITSLLRDASHHKAEWTAIRKQLHSLDMRLTKTEGADQKLDQVRLSVHQQLILSKINGLRTLYDLCNASTMMDYEVYRFLYLMLKASVLKPC